LVHYQIFHVTRNHTRRQHWVPQMYLRNWATSGRLCVADKLSGKILTNQSALNFAQEHDFYGFVDLSPDELRCLVEWTYMSFPPQGVKLIDEIVAVIVLHVLRLRVEKQDWCADYEKSFARVRPKLSLSDKQDSAYQLYLSCIANHIEVTQEEANRLHKITENGFEDFHCAIENGAKLVLDHYRPIQTKHRRMTPHNASLSFKTNRYLIAV